MNSVAMTVTIQKPREFRDIRSDLESRIKSFEDLMAREIEEFAKLQEKALNEHKARLESFKKALVNYRNMLALEREMVTHNIIEAGEITGSMTGEIKMRMPPAQMPLPDFFCSKLEQFGALSKEKLRALAQQASYFPPGENGGRQTHVTLYNMLRNGRLISQEGGDYVLANKGGVGLL